MSWAIGQCCYGTMANRFQPPLCTPSSTVLTRYVCAAPLPQHCVATQFQRRTLNNPLGPQPPNNIIVGALVRQFSYDQVHLHVNISHKNYIFHLIYESQTCTLIADSSLAIRYRPSVVSRESPRAMPSQIIRIRVSSTMKALEEKYFWGVVGASAAPHHTSWPLSPRSPPPPSSKLNIERRGDYCSYSGCGK